MLALFSPFSLHQLISLLYCLSSQLKRMYAALNGQFFLQQSVDHSMASGLWLSFESIRDDEEAEMGLGGNTALHGFMVRVHVRVVVYVESGRSEILCDLPAVNQRVLGVGDKNGIDSDLGSYRVLHRSIGY